MANVGQLTFDFNVNLSAFEAGIDKARVLIDNVKQSFSNLKDNAQKDMSAAAKTFEGFGKSAENFGKKMSLFATLPILGLGMAAAKSAGQFELMEANFTSMLGSAAKAKDLIVQIKDVAAATPYGSEDISRVIQLMLGAQQTAGESMETFKMLGDVAQGNTAKLQGVAVAYSQIMSNGRANGQDMMQLLNNQVSIWGELAKSTGKSVPELRKMSEQGQLTSAMVTKAFKDMTSAGGTFFKGMEYGAMTLPGLWSTLTDSVGELGRVLLADLMPTIKGVIKELTSWAEAFTQMSATGKTVVLVVAGIVAAIGPMINIITKMVTVYQGLATAITFVKSSAVAAQIATALLNATIAAGPWLILAAAIGVVVYGFYELSKAQKSVSQTQAEATASYASLTAEREKEGKSIQSTIREYEKQRAMFQGLADDAKKFNNSVGYADQIRNVKALTTEIDKLRMKQSAADAADPTKQKAAAASEQWLKLWRDAQGKYTKLVEEAGKSRLEMIDIENQREIAALETAHKQKLVTEQQYADARNAILLNTEKKRVAEVSGLTTNVLNTTNQWVGEIGNLFQMADQNRLLQIENRQTKELEAINTTYATEKAAIEGSALTQEQKDAKLKVLDEKRARDEKAVTDKAAKDKRKVEREAAKRNKEIQTVETIISSATGAMKAYESLAGIPFVGPALGAIAAAAVIAFGAAKIALIQSQPLPALAAGGLYSGPAIVGEGGPEMAFPLTGTQGRAALQAMTDAMLLSMAERGARTAAQEPGTITTPGDIGGQMIHNQIYIGDELLYDKITRAMDDGKIRVNSRVLV